MADIPTFAPERQWMVQAVWEVAKARWSEGIYAYSGGCANEQASPDMTVQVDEFISIYGTTAAGNVTIDAAHATLGRIDVLYQTAAGAFAIWKGDNLAISDPLGNYNPSTRANWEQLKAPYPKDGLPAGVPMYEIYVGPAVTAIYDEDLMPIASKGRDPAGYLYVTAPIEVDHAASSPVSLGTAPANSIVEAIIRCTENESGCVLTIGDEDDADSHCTDALMPILTTSAPIVGMLGKQYYASAKALRATITTAGTAGKWYVQFNITVVV